MPTWSDKAQRSSLFAWVTLLPSSILPLRHFNPERTTCQYTSIRWRRMSRLQAKAACSKISPRQTDALEGSNETMSITIDYRQRLLDEISGLSPRELEKIYRVVVFLKEEFMASGEARYYTEPWIQAEQEATEAYRQGGLKSYADIDEMLDDILAEVDDK